MFWFSFLLEHFWWYKMGSNVGRTKFPLSVRSSEHHCARFPRQAHHVLRQKCTRCGEINRWSVFLHVCNIWSNLCWEWIHQGSATHIFFSLNLFALWNSCHGRCTLFKSYLSYSSTKVGYKYLRSYQLSEFDVLQTCPCLLKKMRETEMNIN